jgi:hypothetical protein
MGYAFRREDSKGRVRWTACYRNLQGKVRSAGTFSSERLADRAWQRKEAQVSEGRAGDRSSAGPNDVPALRRRHVAA